MSEMKYSKAQYVEAMEDYFEPDEEITHTEIKVVVARKYHQCMGAQHSGDRTIPAGSTAIYESGIHKETGRGGCYVCLPCADQWIAESTAEAGSGEGAGL